MCVFTKGTHLYDEPLDHESEDNQHPYPPVTVLPIFSRVTTGLTCNIQDQFYLFLNFIEQNHSKFIFVRLTHGVTYNNTLFILIASLQEYPTVYPFYCWWTFESFPVWGYYVSLYMSFVEHIYVFLLVYTQEQNWWVIEYEHIHSVFIDAVKQFSRIVISSSSAVEEFQLLHRPYLWFSLQSFWQICRVFGF